ncbi:TonB-dependent receptor [uncultured Brevundimonas sp.]|uniref:TonB-dependent receptor domain-containing protein n=1 Tax=uncultured Brevundimonas sp. TaxID=213418 RepID=UPI0025ED25D7|nr:TonB-dependent receptor [uncultured Brevundimonas sp.]
MEDDEERTEFRTEPTGNVTNQTRTYGTFATGRNIVGLNQPITRREIGLDRTAFRWDATPQWRLDGDLVYSQAGLETPNTSMEFRTASNANFGFSYDTSKFFPVFTPTNPTAFRNPALFNLQQRRVSLVETDENTTQARFNIAFDDGGDTRNLKAKFGAVLRSSDRSYTPSRTDYTARTGFIYTLDQVDRPGPDRLIEGQYRLTPRIDVATAEVFYTANVANFVATTGNYDITEDVFAGYAQASYRLGGLTLLGGLRYEKTEVGSDAVRATGTTLTPVSNSGDYGNWLPSLHLRWDVRDDVVVRAAWTNTIGRPDFGYLAASENVSFDGSQATLSRGNPGLKARESEGFDLSFEYYPTEGLMSGALFSKSIYNEIFTLSSVQNLDVGRGVEAVIVSTSTNAETAKIRCVEVAFQQTMTMLPAPFDGFGVSANATFLDTGFTFLTTAGRRHTGLFQQPSTTRTNRSGISAGRSRRGCRTTISAASWRRSTTPSPTPKSTGRAAIPMTPRSAGGSTTG